MAGTYAPLQKDFIFGGVLDTLMAHDHVYIEQKIRWVEAITGCCEQNNKYQVYDSAENKQLLFGIEESSDCCNRCFCNPDHTFNLHMVPANGGQVMWGEQNWAGPTLMKRDGCCENGLCNKMLCCWSVNECCQNVGEVFPEQNGPGQRFRLEEKLCNGCNPEIVIYAVGGGANGEDWPMAVITGPACFGGCLELCSDFWYDVSTADANTMSPAGQLGDIATIRKIKPSGLCACCLECCTDVDKFSCTFEPTFAYNKDPNFKACILAGLFYLDFMFFEIDHGMCDTNSNGDIIITFFNCYCSGCICPCCITIPKNEGG